MTSLEDAIGAVFDAGMCFGGNPIAIDRMLESARQVLSSIKGEG